MQFKFAFVSAVLATLAVATPAPRGEPASSCSTGPVQCCDSTQTANSASATALLGLLGIVLQDLNVLVGLTCSPITVIGASGSSCSAQAVCCEDNSHGGLISIGCVPVTL
ncbi:hydrophobin 2 [Lentinula edodes]|uniref:hydrophobin 2 n=1 Tax=Lentinula edodes TaxID=5353 RepID=UPI001E8CBA4A|nr:hydrophobin 2 [Lentinula edodes]KAH7872147.1 hydrophobin 2 [Lentinula edodes]